MKAKQKHIAFDYEINYYQIYWISDEGERILGNSINITAQQTQDNDTAIMKLVTKFDKEIECAYQAAWSNFN